MQVVMTRSAQEFITPLTFAALTGKKVITEMFGAEESGPANVESAIEHIAVAQRIDLLLVAPATADVLGKFAHGIYRSAALLKWAIEKRIPTHLKLADD